MHRLKKPIPAVRPERPPPEHNVAVYLVAPAPGWGGPHMSTAGAAAWPSDTALSCPGRRHFGLPLPVQGDDHSGLPPGRRHLWIQTAMAHCEPAPSDPPGLVPSPPHQAPVPLSSTGRVNLLQSNSPTLPGLLPVISLHCCLIA